jgi:putative tricarboxylic transport membrane protein
MDFVGPLLSGFQVSLQPINVLYCFIGVFYGTLIGVLPGIGPVGAISLLLPATFRMEPSAAIIMLAGIYYGSMYGGSTTSILVNIPGEATSVVTCLDGYQMARKGRAGAALGIAAFGSFIGGTFSVIGLMLLANPLVDFALKFGPPEYFSIMCMGLTILTYLARGSMAKALFMAALGLLLATVGMDVISGKPRFHFGRAELLDGLDLVPLVMGLFGISEIFINIETTLKIDVLNQGKITNLLPTLQDWKDSLKPIVRGSLLGFGLGILPGGGALISSFVSYGVEKRVSKHPEKFGQGAIEGVAGPETANNAATGGAFIPLFTLGIPSNVVMALLLGALLIHGIQPGSPLFTNHPEIFWGTVTSMYVGNAFLLLLNLPLIGIWVKILKIPSRILFPLILLFCIIGSYSVNQRATDLVLMAFFGILGYLLRKLDYEPAPLVLAFVLGPLLENALRQSLILSDGSFMIFISRPISAISLGLCLFLFLSSLSPRLRKTAKKLEVDLT